MLITIIIIIMIITIIIIETTHRTRHFQVATDTYAYTPLIFGASSPALSYCSASRIDIMMLLIEKEQHET